MSNSELGRILGSGKVAEVFEYGSLVAKLYNPTAPKRSAFREAANLAVAESCGLPVPPVRGVQQFGDRWGVIMGRADGTSFAEGMRRHPDRTNTFLQKMALLQLRIHRLPGTFLASLKTKLAACIQQAVVLGEERQADLLSRLALLPEGERLCHGDFHPLNVLGGPGDEIIIDWLDACRGDPAADVCRSYVLMKHADAEIASAYVEAYVGVSDEGRQRILGWLPFVAAARLAEGVSDEADELMAMAGSR